MPVTGAIQIYLNNTNDFLKQHSNMILSIQSGFQRLIRFGMQEDLYVSGDVKHVSFIGTRIVGGNGIDYNSNNGGTDAQTNNIQGNEGNGNPKNVDGSSSANTAGIIIGVVGAAVCIVLLGILFAIDRKRRSVVAADNVDENRTSRNQPNAVGVVGDETALASIQGGFVGDLEDEENPYLVKAPLSEVRVDDESNDPSRNNNATAFLPTAGTSDTIEMEEYDSEEEDNEEEVSVNNDNDGELKVFTDPSDDEEEDENTNKLAYPSPWIAPGGIQEFAKSSSDSQSRTDESSPNGTGKEEQQRDPQSIDDSSSTDKEDTS